MAIVPEPGRCDPSLCNSPSSPFITLGPTSYQLNDASCGFREFPNTVPIKQLLKGSMAVPWVRLRFEGDNSPRVSIVPFCPQIGTSPNTKADPGCWDYTELTTGNISQPGCLGNSTIPNTCREKCRAVIKSFQYGWGAIGSGNVCKIVIHDESGSSFDNWFNRMIRNPQQQAGTTGYSVNKMKVNFGWLVVGGDQDCPAEAVETGATCTNGQGKLICSPDIWFVPLSLVSNTQGNKYIYELEGRDLLMTGQNSPMNNTIGGDGNNRTHFLDACVELGRISQPPFNVQFAQLDESGEINTFSPLRFWKSPNTASGRVAVNQQKQLHRHYCFENGVTTDPSGSLVYWAQVNSGVNPGCAGNFTNIGNVKSCSGGQTTAEDLRTRGPIGTWRCGNKDPIGAIHSWITEVRTETPGYSRDGKGLSVAFDPAFQYPPEQFQPGMPTRGRLLVIGDCIAGSANENRDYNARKMATYIVNGGRCSSVFSFTPSIKWHWNALVAGGGITPTSGSLTNPRQGARLGAGPDWSTRLLNILNIAPTVVNAAPTNSNLNSGGDPMRRLYRSTQENWLTGTPHDTIEAELRVQGDPSGWLCSPALGTGRNVGIIVVNPFYMSGSDANGCPQWAQRSVCHGVLTNRNWWIKGVEHVIKEGSYVTNIKVSLLFGNADQSVVTPECGCPNLVSSDRDVNYLLDFVMCAIGTMSCAFSNLDPSDVGPGVGSVPPNAIPTTSLCRVGAEGNVNYCPATGDDTIVP